ncbi:SHOCT domain-containing protein [Gracilinema caldarium]|uniref:SHOCT domain-containing protein n=1 Tax=Gracilinema caldarium TaxID=215591 RepID=UPI0026EF73ED|nr:SHOCT domain-containing protein [Gracilinema caldarium]
MLLRGFYGYAGIGWFSILHWAGIGILLVLIVWLIISFSRKGHYAKQESVTKGIDILIERYARGEISAETFKAMKSELEATEQAK